MHEVDVSFIAKTQHFLRCQIVDKHGVTLCWFDPTAIYWESLRFPFIKHMSASISSIKPQVINERSTKQAIIEAAQEFISTQDDALTAKHRLVNTLEQEKKALLYLLIATSSIAVLF